MNARLTREYRTFRAHGEPASRALDAARTCLLWGRLSDLGMVRLEVRPDDSYDWSDERERERFGEDGAWGVVGEYRVPARMGNSDDLTTVYGDDSAVVERDSQGQWFRLEYEMQWEHGDSIWGCVGYQDVSSPQENPYVIDIMGETIGRLREALRGRCPVCRRAS